MTDRARVLTVGGVLIGLVIIGLVVGFVVLNDDNRPPNGGVSPSPTPTDVRAQVEQAYLRYWDVYADALLRLDASRLDEVLSKEALENHRQQVDELRGKNQPARVSVEHDYVITLVNDTTASVEDNYISHTVALDPETKEPVEKDPNTRVRRSYTLEKVNGVWKVTLIIGFRSGSP